MFAFFDTKRKIGVVVFIIITIINITKSLFSYFDVLRFMVVRCLDSQKFYTVNISMCKNLFICLLQRLVK